MPDQIDFRRTKTHLYWSMVCGLAIAAFAFLISFNVFRAARPGESGLVLLSFSMAAVGIYILYRVSRAVRELRDRQIYLTLDKDGVRIKGNLRVSWKLVDRISLYTRTQNGGSHTSLVFKKLDGKTVYVSVQGIEIEYDDLLDVVGKARYAYGMTAA